MDDFLPTTYVVTWTSERDHIVQSFGVIKQSSYTITGLTLDAVYTITVTAANTCGTGPEYRTSVSLTSDTVPIPLLLVLLLLLVSLLRLSCLLQVQLSPLLWWIPCIHLTQLLLQLENIQLSVLLHQKIMVYYKFYNKTFLLYELLAN